MCNVGNIILNSVLTFASVWIVRKFLDTFYEKKRWNVLSVSVWSIYIIFQGYVQFHSGDASTVTTIVNVLLCIMISAISYYGLLQILYLIFDYPHKHYTFKHFEV